MSGSLEGVGVASIASCTLERTVEPFKIFSVFLVKPLVLSGTRTQQQGPVTHHQAGYRVRCKQQGDKGRPGQGAGTCGPWAGGDFDYFSFTLQSEQDEWTILPTVVLRLFL